MAMFGAKQNNLDTYEVRLPNGQVVRQQVPVGANDAQVRNAFAEAMKYQGINALQQQVIRPPQNALAEAQKYTGGMFAGRPKAELKTYNPSLSEKARYKLSDMLAGMGLERDHANRLSSRLTSFLNDWTPAGNVTGVADADSELEAQLSMLPLPGPARQAVGQALKGIRAFHGSPHDFDRFDISKIGTGEGVQAYGHGLYFAENPVTASAYQRGLAGYDVVENAPLTDKLRADIAENGGDLDKTIQWYERMAQKPPPAWAPNDSHWQDGLSLLRQTQVRPRGHLYEVNINASPDDLLDWDKLVEDQPDLADRIIPNQVGHLGDLYNNFANSLANFPGDPAARVRAAEEIRRRGIPGLKYFDQGSRAAGQGSRNYVIFDDKIIDIISKK